MVEKAIIIGGSAGSLSAILNIIDECPENYRIPFIIVVHRGTNRTSVLLDVLSKRSKRPVLEVEHYDQLENGKVFLAPANYHLLVGKDLHLELDFSEKVLYSRPSIDISFKSFAEVFQKNLIAVVLSGANKDSAEGAKYILDSGGIVIVQDPKDAEVDIMPQETLTTNPEIKLVVASNQIMNTFVKITNQKPYE